jgi:hypothetical protein
MAGMAQILHMGFIMDGSMAQIVHRTPSITPLEVTILMGTSLDWGTDMLAWSQLLQPILGRTMIANQLMTREKSELPHNRAAFPLQ